LEHCLSAISFGHEPAKALLQIGPKFYAQYAAILITPVIAIYIYPIFCNPNHNSLRIFGEIGFTLYGQGFRKSVVHFVSLGRIGIVTIASFPWAVSHSLRVYRFEAAY